LVFGEVIDEQIRASNLLFSQILGRRADPKPRLIFHGFGCIQPSSTLYDFERIRF
jgi:hypothetical protein